MGPERFHPTQNKSAYICQHCRNARLVDRWWIGNLGTFEKPFLTVARTSSERALKWRSISHLDTCGLWPTRKRISLTRTEGSLSPLGSSPRLLSAFIRASAERKTFPAAISVALRITSMPTGSLL